ncbi:ABC transporter ATP-binding protein [Kiritimatiellota bacterium B12222]|nr:ABC transporter ATP-binding protein [Kiritimatiellota bacterium B12222]
MNQTTRLRPLRDYVTLRLVVVSLVLTLIATLLSLWLPRMLGNLVDELADGHLSAKVLIKQAAFYLLVAVTGALFSKWMRQVPMRWGPQVAHRLRTRLHRHLLQLDENQIHDQRVGELMSRLQSDVNAVSDMLSMGGHSMIRAMFTLGIGFTMMFQRSVPLALLLSALLPVLMLIAFLMIHSVRFRHLKVQEQLGVISSFCQESFGGLRIVRGLGLGNIRMQRFGELNQEYIKRNLFLSRIEVFAWPLIQTGFVLGNVLLLWVGGLRVIRGEIQIGMLVEFQQYLMIMQWPALSIAWTLSLILRGRASQGRLQEILDAVPQVTESKADFPELSEHMKTIQFEKVSLGLNGRQVLKDISFELKPGQRLGITGPTGSGKTVLMQMLLRRQDPESGRVLLGGHDIKELPLTFLYNEMRIAPQEPVLFSMSLEENLRLANPDATKEEMARALYLSALDRDIPQLADGLSTKIGERGVTLSGGQRQRCAIARALLSSPEILLLDDSLSAVDTATESLILERLLPALKGKTLMLISHRYAALRHCDQVLVLKDGVVVEVGAPDDLMGQAGEFAELAERQRLQAELKEDEA